MNEDVLTIRDKILAIMKHYSELKEEYKDVEKE